LNTTAFQLFRDCLWAAWISQANAENGTLNPILRIEARSHAALPSGRES
jgi:hypothetical protein